MPSPTRRAYIAALGLGALAGCLGANDGTSESNDGLDAAHTADEDDQNNTQPEANDTVTDDHTLEESNDHLETTPPTIDRSLPIPDDTDTLLDSIVSGGVPKDGIPSIDHPSFLEGEAGDEMLEAGDPVFGVSINGDARAYPQRILVWHEIVNDVIGDERLAVTYCPLTGTAQGFERGDTEFGVSGQLLNSNLVMYDRETDSYWPQMLATGIRGEHTGAVLREFPLTWTTWEPWYAHHPGTLVLSEETGYARDYHRDPYGGYNPPAGFYANDSLFFSSYASPEQSPFHVKDVVLGARSRDGAVAVHKASLAEAEVLRGNVGDVPYVAVYDPTIDTGYIYRNPSDVDVAYTNGKAVVDADPYPPHDLPLERVLRYDAFWFAWGGYYPDTAIFE